MSEDTRRVLEMVAQGKISVDEASELLKALGEPGQTTSKIADAAAPPRYLNITVHKRRDEGEPRGISMPGAGASSKPGKDVNIKVPLSLVRSGMRLGAILPGGARDAVSQALRDRGMNVDLSKIGPDEIDAVFANMGEITLDVDQGRAQVRISAE